MDPDWKALMPHRPLDAGDATYVERPAESGRAIADMVLAGKSTVLVAGPVGVGKSTELAAAARLLQTERVACLVPLDRLESMRRITADRVHLRIAGQLAELAVREAGLLVSKELRSALGREGVFPLDPVAATVNPFQGSRAALARATIEEVARLSKRPVALLVDGPEKVDAEHAADLFDALGDLPDDLDLVVVVPWSAAYGPRAPDVLRQGERLVSLHALPVEGPEGTAGRIFLRQLLEQRLAPATIPAETATLAGHAAELSGGIPRMFLQLMADAATNAHLRKRGPWPTEDDLEDAVADMRDSFRRILLPGDTDALRAVDGTDGREMPLDRKVRLLAHAALLERVTDHGPVMEPHPIVRALIAPRAPHA